MEPKTEVQFLKPTSPVQLKLDAKDALDRLEKIAGDRTIRIKIDTDIDATLMKLEGKAVQAAFWGGVATGSVGVTLAVVAVCVLALFWGRKS